ncbi:uncharacterized protein LOC127852733 [Dreissena polymorpha]|uniref:uncharacterized protein LOC127852733 n=1 Tax=Dreissena polymorpha TaxID=45954 RepID=UPI002265616C|nr:uncharacterized protein LOC127852733 [Dreissena polymorpha]
MVPGDHDVDASKQARNKQIIDKHMGYMAVSRAPVLSPIEEGGTVRSVKEILTSSRASSVSSLNGEVNHNGESEIPPTIVEEDGNPDDAFPLPIKTEMTSLLTCVCACADHSKPHDSVTVEMDNEGTFQGRLLVDRSERPSIPESRSTSSERMIQRPVTPPKLCLSVPGAVKNNHHRSLPFTTVKQKLAPVKATPYSLGHR